MKDLGRLWRRRSVAGTAVAAATLGMLAAGTAACRAPDASHAAQSGGPSGAASTPTSPAVRALQTAYTQTRAAGTARIAMQANTVAADGALGSPTVREHGLVEFSGHHADLVATLPGNLGTTEIRVIGSTLYDRLPAPVRMRLPGHTAWIKISLPAAAGRKAAAILGGGQASPQDALRVLRKFTNSVTKVGPGKIAGTPVTHYRGTVRSQLVDVWVDPQNRVRRLRVTSPMPGVGSAAPSTQPSPASGEERLQVTLNLSGFGTPVMVNPPPASHTTDLTRLFARSPAPSAQTG